MQSKIKLMPHQVEAMGMTQEQNKVAYYMDMGLGKTFVGSEKAMSYNNQVLVVCQKTKVDDWVDHFKEFYDCKVADLTKKNPDYSAQVLVINYDIVWRRPMLNKLESLTLILDESSNIKNEKSKRTKIFLGAKRPKVIPLDAENVILLSGTPTGGKYEELVTQSNMLGWEISKDEFWAQFINWIRIDNGTPYGFPLIKGYKNVGMLKRRLRDYGAVFMKTEEVLTLPSQNEVIHKIKNHKAYKTFQKDLLVTVDGDELVGDNQLKELLCSRQLASQYNPNKAAFFKDMLESTLDRVIVFYNFNKEAEVIEAACKKLKRPISMVRGGTKDLHSYESCDDSVTMIQYQAGAMGLNLQKACRIIYYSEPLSSELYEQSKKRIHRIGQSRPCFYDSLITENSVEEKIHEVLGKRRDYTNELFRKR